MQIARGTSPDGAVELSSDDDSDSDTDEPARVIDGGTDQLLPVGTDAPDELLRVFLVKRLTTYLSMQ